MLRELLLLSTQSKGGNHKGLDLNTLGPKWTDCGQSRFGRIREFSVATHRKPGEAEIREQYESTVLVCSGCSKVS